MLAFQSIQEHKKTISNDEIMRKSALRFHMVRGIYWEPDRYPICYICHKTCSVFALAVLACSFCAIAFLDFIDETLFMPNEILKRFIKKYIDFHQKFRSTNKFSDGQKYFPDRKSKMLIIPVVIFGNRKSKMLIISVVIFDRFFRFVNIFGIIKNVVRSKIFDENRYIFL